MPKSCIVAAWFTDIDLLPRGGEERMQIWDRTLARTELLSTILSPFPGASLIHIVAAYTGRILPCAGKTWLAIGDAAQAYDPLSGQGITKALSSAMRAAEIVRADLSQSGVTMEEFVTAMDREFENYLRTRRLHYRRERRWPRDPFWQRRSAT